MKHQIKTTVLSGLLLSTVVTYPSIVQAQVTLDRFEPKLRIQYDTSGSGYDGFTQIGGFLPLYQKPNDQNYNLLFLNGNFIVDNGANLGGNVQLGFRNYLGNSNRIIGGYIGFDTRGTDHSTFNQIGLGLETLGDKWDARINGYLPVGTTEENVASNSISLPTEITNSYFKENYLLLDLKKVAYTTSLYESAATGFDAEIGTKITNLGSSGGLRGYGGLYYYDIGGGENTLGWRVRLVANPTRYTNFGVSVQDDDIFGTNVVFSVGALFSGTGASKGDTVQDQVYNRMADNFGRTNTVTVANRTVTVDQSTTQTGVPATNPETGEPWWFTHVNLGNGNSNGMFENPFPTIDEAVASLTTDSNTTVGNDIIYVQGSGIVTTTLDPTKFVLPQNTQILSTGPSQILPIGNSPDLSTTILPLSGSGNFPEFTLPVEFTNESKLSGFNLTGGVNCLTDLTGSITIADNTIKSSAGSSGHGICVINNNTGLLDLTITGNTITGEGNPGNGIFISQNASQINATITDNSIASVSSSGINIYLYSGSTGDITITGNTINEVNVDGINIYVSRSQGNLLISSNTIDASTGGYGIDLQYSESTGDITITSNSIASYYDGINLYLLTSSSGNVLIDGNTITQNYDGSSGRDYYGIDLGIWTNSTANVTISNNKVESEFDSIMVGIYRTSSANVLITGNSVNPKFSDGYGIDGYIIDNSTGNITITNNTIDSPNQSNLAGINFGAATASSMEIQISGNTINTAGYYGIDIYFAQSASGNAVISNNVVNSTHTNTSNTQGGINAGIYQQSSANISITGNTVNVKDIVGINAYIASSSQGTITIANNTITSSSDGIYVYNYTNTGSTTVSITGNSINATGRGIVVFDYPNTSGSISITNNTITFASNSGIYISNSSFTGQMTISGNTIGTITGTGNGVSLYNSGSACVSLTNNSITSASGGYQISGTGTLNLVDSGNTGGTVNASGTTSVPSCP